MEEKTKRKHDNRFKPLLFGSKGAITPDASPEDLERGSGEQPIRFESQRQTGSALLKKSEDLERESGGQPIRFDTPKPTRSGLLMNKSTQPDRMPKKRDETHATLCILCLVIMFLCGVISEAFYFARAVKSQSTPTPKLG